MGQELAQKMFGMACIRNLPGQSTRPGPNGSCGNPKSRSSKSITGSIPNHTWVSIRWFAVGTSHGKHSRTLKSVGVLNYVGLPTEGAPNWRKMVGHSV